MQLSRKIKISQLFVNAGRNSLSTYILQGVITGMIFGGYGLGYFDELRHAVLLPISLLVALLSIVMVGAYASRFGSGPLEPVLKWMSG